MSALLVVSGLVAIALVLIGAFALLAPDRMAYAYGLPVDTEAARGFARATGIRDVAFGVALAAATYYRHVPLLVVLAIAGVVLSLTDFAIAYHASGRRLRRQHSLHFGGIVAFVLILTMALFAIGW
jgi:predicted Na+-dependent transporter